jgi:hypothetical protein
MELASTRILYIEIKVLIFLWKAPCIGNLLSHMELYCYFSNDMEIRAYFIKK